MTSHTLWFQPHRHIPGIRCSNLVANYLNTKKENKGDPFIVNNHEGRVGKKNKNLHLRKIKKVNSSFRNEKIHFSKPHNVNGSSKVPGFL